MKNLSEKEFIEALDYMAWCVRANCFEGYFIKKFMKYGMENFSWDENYAIIYSHDVFNWVNKEGPVRAYQNMITDEEGQKAMVYALNVIK
jgi:ABC-type antimicrobial peptide transport system ATPase subunit